jgi:uncharacterized membrane protein YecN with MAPEG domain
MVIHAMGLILFAGRLAHAIGLSRHGGSSMLRSGGVIATWLAYILGAVALIFYAIP